LVFDAVTNSSFFTKTSLKLNILSVTHHLTDKMKSAFISLAICLSVGATNTQGSFSSWHPAGAKDCTLKMLHIVQE
jgi:hypothetical protein